MGVTSFRVSTNATSVGSLATDSRTCLDAAPTNVQKTVLHVAPVLPRDERAIAEGLFRSQLLWKTVTYTVGGGTWLRRLRSLERKIACFRPPLALDRSRLKSVMLRD